MITFTLPHQFGDFSLLLIRLIIATTFLAEFRTKARNLRKFAKSDGLPLPVAGFVMTAELAAALGMLSGVLAQWAAAGLILLMTGSMGLHIFKWHSPYWASKGGWEYDLMLLAFASVILIHGPGAYALGF
jgi:putative oxidoreductase